MTDIDINKAMAVAHPGASLEQIARADEIAGWSKEATIARAREEGLELTPNHWRAIEILQSIYVEKGKAPHARYVAGLLSDAFEAEGGSKFLYQLFPGGPVTQGSLLACVPLPHDARDLSFGSTY